MTIGTGALCRSWTVQSGAGTTTHTAGVTLTIGDGTPGAGNVALSFPASGWTYTLGSATTSAITFVSTSATQQTVDFAGRPTGNVTYNAASGGSWLYTGAQAMGATATTSHLRGSLDLNGQSITGGLFTSTGALTRALTLGAAAIALDGAGTAWNMVATGLTFSGASATITLSASSPTFTGGGFAYGTLTLAGALTTTLNGANTFATLNRTGTAQKLSLLVLGADQIVTGAVTLAGQSAINRLLVRSDILGTPRTITAASVAAQHVDFRDITGAGAATWDLSAITGGSGNCGGNTLKALGDAAFTPSATQTSTGTASFIWSTHGWTSRVPLPQDDVVISNAFSPAGRTVTVDMPRSGRNISWAGATGTPNWTVTTATEIYGSVTKIVGMTQSGAVNFTFAGRSPATITNAGVTWTNPLIVDVFGTTLTLNDAFTSSSGLTHRNGEFIDAGFSTTFTTIASNSGLARTLTRTGSMTLNGTGNVGVFASAALTYTGTGATTTISETTQGTSKTFAGGGLTTFGALVLSGKNIIITGANTFASLALNNLGDTIGIALPAGVTTTVTGAITSTASAGNEAKLISSSGVAATLSKASGIVSVDYMSITNSTASGGALFFAGTHSTNVSGNTGWNFTDITFTGAAALTQDGQSLGGTGELAISGTAALTQDGQTLSSTGELAISGTATLTQDDQTLSSSSASTISGALNVTQDDQTLSSVGLFFIIGALNVTQDDQTLDATRHMPSAAARTFVVEAEDRTFVVGAVG